jgi:hypothetical protein
VTPLALLDRLHAAGATLQADGDCLHLRSATPLPAALLAEARAHKPALLRLVLGLAAMRAACEARAPGLHDIYRQPDVAADAAAIRPPSQQREAA